MIQGVRVRGMYAGRMIVGGERIGGYACGGGGGSCYVEYVCWHRGRECVYGSCFGGCVIWAFVEGSFVGICVDGAGFLWDAGCFGIAGCVGAKGKAKWEQRGGR